MRFTITREMQAPEGSTKIEDPKSDAVLFVWKDDKGFPCAMGFSGKRNKHDFRFKFPKKGTPYFKTIDEHIQGYIDNCRAKIARKAKEKAEAAALRAKGQPLKVGDILNSSWGYEQTNVTFYQVVETVGKMTVVVRKIGQEEVKSTGPFSSNVAGIKDAFCGEPFRRKVNLAYGPSIKVCSSERATPWDGKPTHSSWGY